MASISLETVKKYAPAARFHQDERSFPCSIEHLLQGSSLNRRMWRPSQQIPSQHTQTPAAASFQGRIWIVYPAYNDLQLCVSSSADGSNWESSQIQGQFVNSPKAIISMTVFQDKLWIAYTGRDGPHIYVSCSADGKSWEYRRVEGQSTWAPVMTAYNGGLYMVYSSDRDSSTWQTESKNGWDWFNTRPIPGQEFDNACLITFKGKLHLMFAGGHGSDLYSFQYDLSSGNWNGTKIEGQFAFNVALAPCQDWLVMVYSSNRSSQFYCSQSLDGFNWQDTQKIPGQNGSVPAFVTHGDRAYMIYAAQSDGQLYITSISTEHRLTPFTPIDSPTQDDLMRHADEDYFVTVAESQWSGQPIPQAPMYYAVQETNERVEIHYIFLYAKQDGQTVRALRAGSEFNCIIYSYGEHQGDLERYMVSLSKKTSGDSPTTTYTFEKAQFEAHGASTDYTDPAEVRWIDDTHAVLNIGLNNHGIFNPVKIDNPHYDDRIAGVVGIGNFFGDDEKRVQWWKPWESSDFRLLGLKDGQPIGDQAWAAFRGRLGDSYPTKLKGAVYFDGRNLSQPDWWYVSIVAAGASALNKLPSNVTFADGPDGPAGRKWVKQQGVQGAV